MQNTLIDTIEFERVITINGIETKVSGYINVGDDPEGIDTLELQRDISAVESGEVVSAIIQVQVFAHGIEGFDSLGACMLRANDLLNEVNLTVEFNDMIGNACYELSKNIRETAKKLQPYMVQS